MNDAIARLQRAYEQQIPALDVEALYAALDRRRRGERLRWRRLAPIVGVSPSTFTRLSQGCVPNVEGLIRMLAWLGETDLKPYLTGREETRP